MNIKLILILSFLGVNICPKPLFIPKIAAETTSQANIQQITVRIDSPGNYGSGVIVERDRHSFYVLTNAHVVDRPNSYRIVTADGKVHHATSRTIVPGLDLALLSFTSDRNYAVAAIETGNSAVATKIRVGGWSRSGGSLRQPIFVTTQGNLTAVNSKLPLGYALTYSNLVRAGMSGGPIVNAAGKLIGINGVVRLEDRSSNRIVASGIPIARYWQWRKELTHFTAVDSTHTPIHQQPNNDLSSSGYVVAQTLSAGSAVNTVIFNPVNRTIVSGSSNGTIALWQQGQDRPISHWQNQTSVNALAVSPNGKMLASSGDDGKVRIWDATSGQPIQMMTGHTGAVTSLVFSPDRQTLISSGWDRKIRIWQLDTGKLLTTLAGHSQVVNAIALSPDGKILASGGQDRTIRFWNVATGELIDAIQGHSLGIVSLAISPNNNILASGSGDGIIKIWNLNTNRLIHTLQGHIDGVWSLAIAADNQTLFSASWDKTIKVWDLTVGSLKHNLTGHQDYITSLSLGFDGQTLISGDFQGKIYIWKPEL